MTGREELIEEAAKAMVERASGETWEDCDQAWYLVDARVAFAVFEKAQAPTDDEREALVKKLILESLVFVNSESEPWAQMLANRILSALRRPAQAEPTDEEREALAHAIRKGSGASRYQSILLADQILPHLDGFRRPAQADLDEALCGDWPAPCNCDDPDTHDGRLRRPAQTEPTNDEREEIVRIIGSHVDLPVSSRLVIARSILAAGFRRPAQTEPTGAQVAAAVAELRQRFGASNGTHTWIEFQGDPHFIVNTVLRAAFTAGQEEQS